jgi:hypothetical protein
MGAFCKVLGPTSRSFEQNRSKGLGGKNASTLHNHSITAQHNVESGKSC